MSTDFELTKEMAHLLRQTEAVTAMIATAAAILNSIQEGESITLTDGKADLFLHPSFLQMYFPHYEINVVNKNDDGVEVTLARVKIPSVVKTVFWCMVEKVGRFCRDAECFYDSGDAEGLEELLEEKVLIPIFEWADKIKAALTIQKDAEYEELIELANNKVDFLISEIIKKVPKSKKT